MEATARISLEMFCAYNFKECAVAGQPLGTFFLRRVKGLGALFSLRERRDLGNPQGAGQLPQRQLHRLAVPATPTSRHCPGM